MADVLRIAKERRAGLLCEIAKLDEFIRMAEALEQDRESWSSLEDSLFAENCARPEEGRVYSALEIDDTAAPARREGRSQTPGSGEPPMLLLPDHRVPDHPAHSDPARGLQEVETRNIVQSAPGPRKSGLAGYLEGLRAQIQRHFGSSEAVDPSARAAVEPLVHGEETQETSRVGEAVESPPMPAALSPSRFLTLRKGGSSPPVQHSADVEEPTKPQEGSGRSAVFAKSHELSEEPTPRPFGRHLGQKVRQRRWMLGLSREQLGNRLGLTIEQIARYEIGKAEIDSTRLWDIATALQVPIAFFFEGLDDRAKSECEARADILSDHEAHLLQDLGSQDTIHFSSSRSA